MKRVTYSWKATNCYTTKGGTARTMIAAVSAARAYVFQNMNGTCEIVYSINGKPVRIEERSAETGYLFVGTDLLTTTS